MCVLARALSKLVAGLLLVFARYFYFFLLLFFGLSLSSATFAAPSAKAVRLEVAPVLDGEVLGDEVWGQPSLSGFWQQRPVEGARSTQETEV